MKFKDRIKSAWNVLKGNSETVELNNLLKFLGVDNFQGKALSEVTYFACLKVLSEAIGKLPLKILQYNDKNGVSTAHKHLLYNVVHDRPNPYMTSSIFWSTVEYNRNHYGNAYVLINGAGSKTTLWILPSSSVDIKVNLSLPFI